MIEPVIYQITNRVNGKQYFGKSTRGVAQRWREHLWSAERGSILPVHHAIRKHGPKCFEILPWTTVYSKGALLNEVEKFAIRYFNTRAPRGYNLTSGGNGTGHKHTPETIVKLRACHLGKKLSTETIAKMRSAHLGKTLSAETIARIRATRIGTTLPVETIAKIRAGLLGKKRSAASIAKIRGKNNSSYKHHVSTELIRDLVTSGLSQRTVAKRFGIACSTVQNRLKEYAFHTPGR